MMIPMHAYLWAILHRTWFLIGYLFAYLLYVAMVVGGVCLVVLRYYWKKKRPMRWWNAMVFSFISVLLVISLWILSTSPSYFYHHH